MISSIWIFNGVNGRFPSGVFDTIEKAEEWIEANHLTGILTNFPINRGVYEWAIEKEYFKPNNEEQKTADFIGRFTSASQEHYHYDNGKRD